MHRHPSLRGWGGSTFAALAVATFSAIAVAPPWDGDKIVFGETEQGRAFSLDSAASASGVYFRCPATLGGAGPLTLVAPALIYGGGELLTPLAGSDGMAVTNCFSSSRSVFPQKSAWTTIWPNAALADVVDIAGEVTGIWSGSGIYFPTTLVTFEKAADGLSATAQFHIMVASGVPRAFKLAFRQNGANVEAQILWAKYSGDPAKFGLDWDAEPSGTSNYTPRNSARATSASRICAESWRRSRLPVRCRLATWRSPPKKLFCALRPT